MTRDQSDERSDQPGQPEGTEQPEPEASSDGDGSWTADPQTQDPDEDRSVDAVVEGGSGT